ncbi:hypothetical protein RvY_18168-2 [Ramazzottius varieornatus]|uniref:PiggyBac transposable element-derived protein domain-containing protein n=1 Tax=Ramazzottius varieornatus TaxID=947166 RepID=A0A1D1W4S8_RAMVA|nr:hypothetical protein RvY_18168-2 [Ramazzottius varieornatus]
MTAAQPFLFGDVSIYFLEKLMRKAKKRNLRSLRTTIVRKPEWTLDQLTGNYSVRRKTFRWPMALFYDIVDISVLNSYVVWTELNPDWHTKSFIRRRKYLHELSRNLMESHLRRRFTSASIPSDVKLLIKISLNILSDGKAESNPSVASGTKAQQRCRFCHHTTQKRSRINCSFCKVAVCADHRNSVQTVVCVVCAKTQNLLK